MSSSSSLSSGIEISSSAASEYSSSSSSSSVLSSQAMSSIKGFGCMIGLDLAVDVKSVGAI